MNTYIVTSLTHDDDGGEIIKKKTVIAPDELTAAARGYPGEIIRVELWSDEGEDFGYCPYANIPTNDDAEDRPYKTEDF